MTDTLNEVKERPSGLLKTETSITASEIRQPRVETVHFVGSLPHGSKTSPGDVFESLCSALPGRLLRVPDGELGERHYYINYQHNNFSEHVLRRGQSVDNLYRNDCPIDSSHEPSLNDVKPNGYDTAAIASYQDFLVARKAGKIPSGVRFQISLPLPLELVGCHVEPTFQAKVAPLCEIRMIQSLEAIQAAIPASDLAIQWDLAVGIAQIEAQRGRLAMSRFAPWEQDPVALIQGTIKRMLAAIHTERGVAVGLHICYGDIEHRHFVEPDDLSLCVDFANYFQHVLDDKRSPGQSPSREQSDQGSSVASSQSTNAILTTTNFTKPNWVHMPVPNGRLDEAYYEPLQQLRLGAGTQLVLGLIHHDELEKTRERIKVAAKVYNSSDFSIATECGLGRTPPEHLPGILDIARQVTGP